MEKEWYLYILRCADGSLYTGIATDVERRFREHCSGKGAKYTRGRGPLTLLYQELCGGHGDALKREWAVKALPKNKKQKLIEKRGRNMNGIAYGVGVGPGDPEMMTLKAVRLIRENDVIALPGLVPEETFAYQIAVAAVPELADKELISVYMPMTHDKAEQERCHREGAAKMEEYLRQGKNVVYLTLGDSTIFCTFSYLQKYLEEDGFETRLVNGIPSFCAAAARVNQSLSLWNEQIHVLPAVHNLNGELPANGTCVLMKSGSKMKQVKEQIIRSGRDAVMVENCGTENEKVYLHVEDIPDNAGYYSLIIAK